jgi:hypothetical protein
VVTERRHHLRRGCNVEARLLRHVIAAAAKADVHVSKGMTIHVHDAWPGHAACVEAWLLVKVKVVVDECRQQIVRGSDGVKVAGEMKVDAACRNDLARAVVFSGAAFATKRRSKGRFAERETDRLAELRKALGKPDAVRGLFFVGERWCDGGHQHQARCFVRGLCLEKVGRDLRDLRAEAPKVVGVDAECASGVRNKFLLCIYAELIPPMRVDLETKVAARSIFRG